ncbi:hypothetical protein WN944_022319 [Citrus x changshan-huyou]|uniref:Uncharacterized protein n=1 Tax=Citrus x changshan-huyou TaxID=2935761 RepID=A0AAP0N1C7_9ROSI
MALLVPGGGCARLAISHPAQVSRRTAVVATLSPPKLDKVDYWVDATSSFFEPDSRPIMLYDVFLSYRSAPNDCSSSYLRLAIDRRIRYEALQSESGKKLLRRSGRAPDDISSVVLVEKDRSYIKSDAVLKIMDYIDLPFPQLAFFLQFVPQFVRDFAYDNIANNRYNIFGRSDSCELYDK